jgi:excisionase family DNA binding protein
MNRTSSIQGTVVNPGNPEADSRNERWLTKGELARYLRYSERWVELRVREGLPHFRVGSQLRFRISEVEDYFRNQEVGR